MKNKIAKMTLCLMLVLSLLLTSGCMNFGGEQYKTVKSAQGLTTQCLEDYQAVSADEGLYIFTETENMLPYVLVTRYGPLAEDVTEFLNTVIVPFIKELCGDGLISLGEVKNYSVAGKKLPGVSFSYQSAETQISSLCICEMVDDEIIGFMAECLEKEDTKTMNALEAAIKYLEVDSSVPAPDPKPVGPDVNIVKSPAELLKESLVDYADPNSCFTARIPSGWNVSYGGKDMYFWIKISAPDDPCLQVFTLLKADALLKSQSAKNFYQKFRNYDLYKSSADALVVTSVEDFYNQFMDYCGYTTEYSSFLGFFYDGFDYPQITEFETIESFENSTSMPVTPIDDKILHGSFTEPVSQMKGEGMFSGTLYDALVMPQGGIDVGYNAMYNVNGITASYGMFGEYKDVLLEILHSIQYTDIFLQTVATNQHQSLEAAKQLNATLQATSDIITSGWNERQKSYDAISAKYSDATLGYETVYDVETGEVYKAYNGFTDIPGIDQYFKPATDEMYSEPIAGYIEK